MVKERDELMRRVVWLAASLAACGASVAGQSNDVTIHNMEGGKWLAPSNPSVGFPPGSFPPDLGGDCFWKVLPGDRVLAHADAGGETMTITGFVDLVCRPCRVRGRGPSFPTAARATIDAHYLCAQPRN